MFKIIRRIDSLVSAHHTEPRTLPAPSSAAAKLGLQFERRVLRELLQHQAAGRISELTHNPWFTFTDASGTGLCCPDFILRTPNTAAGPGGLTIIEVKLTWVEDAERKLRQLYSPIVARVYGVTPNILVLCRRLDTDAPPADLKLGSALAQPSALLIWPNNGRIPW